MERLTCRALDVLLPLVLMMSGVSNASADALCAFGDPDNFEKITSKKTSMIVVFVAFQPDARGGWANYDGSAGWFSYKLAADRRFVIAVPIMPAISSVSLGAAALGEYQTHYHDAAAAMAKYGHGDAIVRVGWEFQGNWYPWGYSFPGQDQAHFCANYKAAFRNVVSAFRAVSKDFKFDWNTNLDRVGMPAQEDCYPGDDVVDFIGMDVYDDNYQHVSDPAKRFANDVMDRDTGLKWQARFAASHHKPISFPEWGAGKVDDNPYFVQSMHDWFVNNDVAYQCYWNVSVGYDADLETHPAEKKKFQELFGAKTTQ